MERQDLIEKYGQPSDVTNRHIIQIYKDVSSSKLTRVTAAIWILKWMGRGDTNVPLTILKSKVQRVAKKAASLRRAALEKYENEPFQLPESYLLDLPPAQPASSPSPTPLALHSYPSTSSLPVPASVLSPPSPPPPTTSLIQASTRKKRTTPMKTVNTFHSKILKQERKVLSLNKRLRKLNEGIDAEGKKRAHYTIKNVKKREERNRLMRNVLRNENNKHRRLAKQYGNENERLKKQIEEFQRENTKLKERVARQESKLRVLTKVKRLAESKAEYHKRRSMKLKEESKTKEDHEGMVPEVGQNLEWVIETKSHDGKYTPETRLCVMDLLGLDVATGKIAPVMESVGALCGARFSHLPSRQTCQQFADEGQVIAKMFVKERTLESGSFGLHKDGTTRRKVKILDTSVYTQSGEAYCLGWSSVSSETGKAIAEEGKEKLGELVEDEEEMKRLLQSLKYTMSDRAANEKKSNQILEEWREETLLNYGEDKASKIHHLFCLAHVLLGFQSYTINGIKKLEKYASSDLKHPIVLVLKDSSDLFGPVGDYRGVRNQWEAFCIENNIKSTIKAFKDNRFNGLFEVAAQVFHHHENFLTLLEAQSSLNFKQARLLKALKNPNLILLLECLALFFHKVTGPFWSMTVTKFVSVSMLRTIIQQLDTDLEICSANPNHIFSPDSFSFHQFRSTLSSQETKQSLSKEMKEGMKEVIATISSSLLSTVRKQLSEFLETGQYGSSSADQELDHLSFAPLSNLVCERNFGHLDSSQRRRPHSSLHHHTSVILLKQTRNNIKTWYSKLTSNEKKDLWERARKKGNSLRQKHRQQDRTAIMESLPVFRQAPVLETTASQEHLKPEQMIAVACQDNWYPAVVQDESLPNQEVTVSFAELGKALGAFKWPTGKDIHTVSRGSIVSVNLEVQPRAGGRTWIVQDAKAIQAKFKCFV